MADKNCGGHLGDAFVAVKNGEIKYFSAAAAQMIPGIESIRPEDIFPDQLLGHETESLCAEVDIAGRRSFVIVRTCDDFRIFSIISPDADMLSEMANLMMSVGVELKNTLTVFKMASGLLLPQIENIGDSRLDRYSSMLYHSYYNVLRLTNNLSDLAKILHNDVPMIFSNFDLTVMSQNLVDSVRHFMGDQGVSVIFESSEDHVPIYADYSKIEKMLLNLLANSLSNTAQGGSVRVKLSIDGQYAVINVADNGTGIPNDIMMNAWSRYHVPKQLTDTTSGVGLGLTLVYNIAYSHGGRAVLESKPGTGTSVTVSIPLKQPESDNLQQGIIDESGQGMQQILTELSRIVSYDKYTQQYMD